MARVYGRACECAHVRACGQACDTSDANACRALLARRRPTFKRRVVVALAPRVCGIELVM